MKTGLKLLSFVFLFFFFFIGSIFSQEFIYIPSSSNNPSKSEKLISSNRFFGIEVVCSSIFASDPDELLLKKVATEKNSYVSTDGAGFVVKDKNHLHVRRNSDWKDMVFSYNLISGLLHQTKIGKKSSGKEDELNVELAYFPSTTRQMITPEAFKAGVHLKQSKDLSWMERQLLSGSPLVSIKDGTKSVISVPTLTMSGFFYRVTFGNKQVKLSDSEQGLRESQTFEALCKKFEIPYVKGAVNVGAPVFVKGKVKLHIIPLNYSAPVYWQFIGGFESLDEEISHKGLGCFTDFVSESDYDEELFNKYGEDPVDSGMCYIEYISEPVYFQHTATQYMIPTDAQNIQKLFDALSVKIDFDYKAVDKKIQNEKDGEKLDQEESQPNRIVIDDDLDTSDDEDTVSEEEDDDDDNYNDELKNYRKKLSEVFDVDFDRYEWAD